MLLPAESLKLTAVSSLGGSRGLRNMAALMLFAIESHSSAERPCPNQSMKPTPEELTHSLPLIRPSAFPSMSHGLRPREPSLRDRKSTRLNFSHVEIYTLSLHDALPIYPHWAVPEACAIWRH